VALFGKVAHPIGLDIGSNVLRVAQLKPASSPILTKYSKRRTEGCLVDGEVTYVDVLAKEINNLLKQAGISAKRVILGISNQKVIVRLLTMPYMEKDDLDNAIQFQAQDNIPIPVEEAILDYHIVNEFKNEDNERSYQIILVAAQREMIESHIRALEKAKLKPYAVDVSSFALSRSLLSREAVVPDEKELEKNTKAIGFLDIGETVTNISIVQNRMPFFSRVTPIGDATFVKAVADNLAISIEEAQKQRDEIGFSKPGADLEDGLKKSQLEVGKKVRKVLSGEVTKFVNEVRRSFEYGLTETTKSEDLNELIISGEGAQDTNLVAYLKKSYPKVTVGNIFNSIAMQNKDQLKKQSAYAIAVGLALRGIDE